MERQAGDHDLAEALAKVSRALQSEPTAQETLQKIVELAVATVHGCDHAGITIMNGRMWTPAATGDVPRRVDQIQYATNEGPCLDAIRQHRMFVTGDLLAERRWPRFSTRTVQETGVRSMLSFRLFLNQDTLGSLNMYSTAPGAFDLDSQAVGEVFASHAALAWSAAREHERMETMSQDLHSSRELAEQYAEQAGFAAALQRSMLTELPDLSPLEVTARYLPATRAAQVGGDWYDGFVLPDGAVALAVGDLAGHDIDAAVAMGQARNVLRTLAVDRPEPPGELLSRFDAVASHLALGRTGTCLYARLDERDGQWQAALGNAGHLPPLLITDRDAKFLDLPHDPLLGTDQIFDRATTRVGLPAGSTLLLFTDGLVERRDRDLADGLALLRDTAAELFASPVDELCDELLRRLVPHPADDVCLLAVRLPGSPAEHPTMLTIPPEAG